MRASSWAALVAELGRIAKSVGQKQAWLPLIALFALTSVIVGRDPITPCVFAVTAMILIMLKSYLKLDS